MSCAQPYLPLKYSYNYYFKRVNSTIHFPTSADIEKQLLPTLTTFKYKVHFLDGSPRASMKRIVADHDSWHLCLAHPHRSAIEKLSLFNTVSGFDNSFKVLEHKLCKRFSTVKVTTVNTSIPTAGHRLCKFLGMVHSDICRCIGFTSNRVFKCLLRIIHKDSKLTERSPVEAKSGVSFCCKGYYKISKRRTGRNLDTSFSDGGEEYTKKSSVSSLKRLVLAT